MELSGVPASPGLAIGRAVTLRRAGATAAPERIAAAQVDAECRRFRDARDLCAGRLTDLSARARDQGRDDEASILDAHAEMIRDDGLERDIADRIARGLLPAERAVAAALDEIVAEMNALGSAYARERSKDFADLKGQLVRAFAGESPGSSAFEGPSILVGHDLTPADTATLDREHLLGMVGEGGGPTAHMSIVARGLGIPAVVGIERAAAMIHDGDLLIVDGSAGLVIVHPPEPVLAAYRERQARLAVEAQQLDALRTGPTATADGRAVRLCANIASLADLDPALRNGAEGIGLLRTEFLFLGRDAMPDEEEQFQAYSRVAAAMNGRGVVIRTLDVGGDKPLPYLPMRREANPFLGRRGVRLYADCPDLIRAQLRAIVRASQSGAVHLLFPMISSRDEVDGLRGLLGDVMAGLRRDGVPFHSGLPVGIMIETPASALIADRLIRAVDFFSIGSNDLTQYTMAADRGHEGLVDLQDPLHPAVLRLIRMAVEAAHSAGKWAGICGEAASDEVAVPLLLGLGLDELSVSPARIPDIRGALRRSSDRVARRLTDAALAAGTAREVRSSVGADLEERTRGGHDSPQPGP